MLKGIVVSLMLAGVMVSQNNVSADQAAPMAPGETARFGALRPKATNPYGRMFDAKQSLQTAAEQLLAAERAKPKVVCGMTMIPADPNVDAKMRITPPANSNTKYTIRAIDPPACNPSK